MTQKFVAPAAVPPAGLAGLDPSWSRLVEAPDHRGVSTTWHVLDNYASHGGNEPPTLTVICVHGNPSWSYLWRNVVRDAPAGVRVIAVDQLEMGFSERTGIVRRLAHRVDDLCQLSDTLGVEGPVVTIAHDWGGPISLGWALRHRPQLEGVVLTNTAVHQPAGSPAPTVIRATRVPLLLKRITTTTPAFVHAAIEMSRPRLDPEIRAGLFAPYRSAERREAIATFVEDIPLDPSHPSAAPLDAIAAGLADLADTPALLLWGPADPVFSDLYLHDLEHRLPHADVHRFVGASHFVSEQADVVGAFYTWLDQNVRADTRPDQPGDLAERAALHAQLTRRADSSEPAVLECTRTDGALAVQQVSFAELHDRVEALADGLLNYGVAPGDRVALMVPPGVDLSTLVYACWRIGVVMVLVDSGLGPQNMSRALASANPAWLIGIDKALAAAHTLRWPGRRIAVRHKPGRAGAVLAETSLDTLIAKPQPRARPDIAPEAPAALVFTSGSTGPSKGVAYTHSQIQAQRDTLAALYDIDHGDRLVAAFAPFALYGPALGITSVVPDMDITKPGTLTAQRLAEAIALIDATLVFASPAALENVVATAGELTDDERAALDRVRLVLSAGAPVPVAALQASAQLFTNAALHTPYGMTELLPVADISLTDRLAAHAPSPLAGVCVGTPAPGVTASIDPLDHSGNPVGQPAHRTDVLGEIVVTAAHQKSSYDRLWYTEASSRTADGHHRSGDIGSIDEQGRLWVAGRLQHVITTPDGPVAPVGLEQQVETLDGVRRAAAVGVGPAGNQRLVLAVELINGSPRRPLMRGPHLSVASATLADQVRATVDHTSIDVAAVLVAQTIPTDRRHNSKIDRSAVAAQAEKVLRGS